MGARTAGIVVSGGLLVLGACSAGRAEQTAPSAAQSAPPTAPVATAASSTLAAPTTDPPTSTVETTASSAAPATTPPTDRATTTVTTPPPPTTPPATTTTPPPTTPPPTTTERRRRPRPTTTTTIAPLPVHTPECVIEIAPGDSLSLIAEAIDDEAVTVEALQLENFIADPDRIEVGDYLDICVGNELDDVTGEPWVPPTTPPTTPPGEGGSGVAAQQQQLNALFAGTRLPALAVDGDSGRLTEQQLCAARLALGLPVSRADMAPGGAEERALMSAGSLPIPAGAPTWASRWVLIDQTCQIMFAGEGSNRVVFVFQTSTGEAGHETRDQNGSPVFRYDPALENGGWHNSSLFPVPADNPLNGNMYRPLYFDNGQAIHGANNVPTDPQSKGCARLRVDSQDALIEWLGLAGASGPIWDSGQINLVVSVQGSYF